MPAPASRSGGVEAGKNAGWRDGIGRLMEAKLDEPVRALLGPYLDGVAASTPRARSPPIRLTGAGAIGCAAQTGLIACELGRKPPRRCPAGCAATARPRRSAIDG